MLLQKKKLDCTPFADMWNLKELILHDGRLTNPEAFARMPQLKRLILAGCTFEGGDLSALSGAPALKKLGLNVMSGAGLAQLGGLMPLKCLQVRALTDFNIGDLASFKSLQELRIEKMGLRDAAFFSGMKHLKKLDLWDSELADLDFLKELCALAEFHLTRPAENEDGLSSVSGLSKLKEFIYPVRNLAVYQGNGTLRHVGMAAGITEGFEVFAGSGVNSFTLIGAVAEGEPERVKEQMEKYVEIWSWGSQKG